MGIIKSFLTRLEAFRAKTSIFAVNTYPLSVSLDPNLSNLTSQKKTSLIDLSVNKTMPRIFSTLKRKKTNQHLIFNVYFIYRQHEVAKCELGNNRIYNCRFNYSSVLIRKNQRLLKIEITPKH